MSDLNFTISSKKLVAASIMLLISWVSYISLQSITNGKAIASLETRHLSDDRQDVELREIRKTLKDMTYLFFQNHNERYEEPESFEAVQMAIHNLVESKK